MAKLSFILTLFLISFSYSTVSSAKQDEDPVDLDIPTKSNILLPSENQEPEETVTVGFADFFPEKLDAKKNDKPDLLDPPMKIVRFHPINRHFPASRLGSFRVHRCRHGMIDGKPMRRPRQMTFGDDIRETFGENGDFDRIDLGDGDVSQVPERWIRIHQRLHRHHHHDHDEDGLMNFPSGKHHDHDDNDVMRRFSNKKHHGDDDHDDHEMRRFPMGKHHDFFANRRFKEERDGKRDGKREKMHEREKKHNWGFMRNVRKFLNGRF